MEKILLDIQRAIKGRRLTLSNEKILQRELSLAFDDASLEYKQEVKLGELGIVDFMFDSLAVEVKIKGQASTMSIYRQIERYSESESVDSILIITSKTMSLPSTINNKPIYILSLGRTQL